MVRGAAQRLLALGFSGPETHHAGTDFHVTFRRGAVEVSVFSEDMGTDFPAAHVRWQDGSWTDVTESGTYPTYGGAYPAHERVWTADGWWGRRAVRKELEPVLREEFERRVRRLVAAATDLVEESGQGTGAV